MPFLEPKNMPKEIIMCDSVWRLLQMRQELEEQPMNIPLIAISAPNDNLGAEFLAVSISQRVTAQHIVHFIEATKKHLIANFDFTDWKPSVMIDDGSAEVAAFEILKWDYFLCKFHLIKTWNKHMTHLTEEQQFNLRGILYQLYASKTRQQYENMIVEMQENYSDFFTSYFKKNWHDNNFFLRWTNILRPNSYGPFNTNNLLERKFRSLRHFCPKMKKKRPDELIQVLIRFSVLETRLFKFRKPYSMMKNDANQRFFASPSILVDIPLEPLETIFFVHSTEFPSLRYRVDLALSCCDCADYFYTARTCKHIYAACCKYLEGKNIELPNSAFETLITVFCHIHYATNWKTKLANWKHLFPITHIRSAKPPTTTTTANLNLTGRIENIHGIMHEENDDAIFVLVLAAQYEEQDAEWIEYKAENEEMHNALQVFIAELNQFIEKRGKGNGYGFKVGTIVKKGVLYFVDDTEYTKGMSSAVLDFFEKY